jgi:hypothetical protein
MCGEKPGVPKTGDEIPRRVGISVIFALVLAIVQTNVN